MTDLYIIKEVKHPSQWLLFVCIVLVLIIGSDTSSKDSAACYLNEHEGRELCFTELGRQLRARRCGLLSKPLFAWWNQWSCCYESLIMSFILVATLRALHLKNQRIAACFPPCFYSTPWFSAYSGCFTCFLFVKEAALFIKNTVTSKEVTHPL